jgi:hypothetical protein
VATSAPESSEYPSNLILQQLAIGGDYVGTLVIAGSADNAACQMNTDNLQNCPIPQTYVSLADVDPSSPAVDFATPEGTRELVISAAGAAAWIEPGTSSAATSTGTTTTSSSTSPSAPELVVASLVSHRHKLVVTQQVAATGAISDVKLSGLTLVWSEGGQRQQLTVQRAAG